MKTKLMLMLVFSVFILVSSTGQTNDLLDTFKKSAQEVNENDNNRNTNSDNSQTSNSNDPEGKKKSPSPNNNNPNEQWEKNIKDVLRKYDEGLGYFNTRATSCIYLMVLYLDGYFDLVESVEKADNCELKSDLLSTQAYAIGSSTTIMYCPEELYNLTPEERDDIYINELVPILKNPDNNPIVEDWKIKLRRVTALQPGESKVEESSSGGDVIYRLCLYFTPQYMVTALFNIQRQIEALGCSD